MRRKDREVTDFSKIVSFIDKCEILRLGLSDGDFPYIVPVNFSYEILEDKKINFYIHGAVAGRKFELMKKNKLCSFEMDTPLKMDFLYKEKDITMRYESVMGTAKIEFIADNEKENIMQNKILSRTKELSEFPWNKAALKKCAVARLCVISISAKENPLNGNAD